MALDPIQPGSVGDVGKAGTTPVRTPVEGEEFKRFLLDNLNRVNEMQQEADQAVENLATGKETDITRVMGAVEKADVAFQTLMSVRNKLVEAYQEILRMRI
jgi:flagellar hook-basal body complex protein FliE